MSTNPPFRKSPENPFAVIVENPDTGQKSLRSAVSFVDAEIITPFKAGSILPAPTYLTVQTGLCQHITLQPQFLQYINHSCQPNVFFDTARMELVALLPIEKGDEFTFFYPSTEWDMAQPFLCQCGKPNCLQLIRGAAHLSGETLMQYRLTDFIQQQIFNRSVPVTIA